MSLSKFLPAAKSKDKKNLKTAKIGHRRCKLERRHPRKCHFCHHTRQMSNASCFVIHGIFCLHCLTKPWGLKEFKSHMSVFTYKDQPVDPWVVPPKLRRLIQLVQLVDPLQHHLVGFTWKSHYALKTHTHTCQSDTLTTMLNEALETDYNNNKATITDHRHHWGGDSTPLYLWTDDSHGLSFFVLKHLFPQQILKYEKWGLTLKDCCDFRLVGNSKSICRFEGTWMKTFKVSSKISPATSNVTVKILWGYKMEALATENGMF